ncbi:MAG TPA: divalent-cation tolerance protein CutA [Pseudonocardiaceae bacterium]|nr:divalent-cation tolerance protein CutA [Pseudonocardiaceae bacterium]
MAADYYQVGTTTGSQAEALALASSVVEARLGACAQVSGPITSVYRWAGEVSTDEEWDLTVKTAADRLPALIDHLKANHSYDLPQILTTEIAGGSPEYLAWITEETRESAR